MSAKTHGYSQTKIYKLWAGMRDRCSNPNNPKYYLYGGRGIRVCERWQNFPNFYEDMGDKPDGMSLDRIDPDLGYDPTNCRWATYAEQSHHLRYTQPGTSGHKGVYLIPSTGKWRAMIQNMGKIVHLGVFNNIEDAIKARAAGEKLIWSK